MYGQTKPPVSDLRKINAEIYILCGSEDRFTDYRDLSYLFMKLAASPAYVCSLEYDHGHLSLLWGHNMDHLEDIFAILNGKMKGSETCGIDFNSLKPKV